MKLDDTQITAALDRAVDACIHMEDKGERATAIRRQAVVEGAALMVDQVSAWLVEQSPELHAKFLAAFSQ